MMRHDKITTRHSTILSPDDCQISLAQPSTPSSLRQTTTTKIISKRHYHYLFIWKASHYLISIEYIMCLPLKLTTFLLLLKYVCNFKIISNTQNTPVSHMKSWKYPGDSPGYLHEFTSVESKTVIYMLLYPLLTTISFLRTIFPNNTMYRIHCIE